MPQHAPIRVSSTDWFKILGIAAFLIDHAGLFFFPDDDVWRVFGRVAAPIFFFFLGFAHSRSFPVSWLVWGVLLTGMEWWIEGDLTLKGVIVGSRRMFADLLAALAAGAAGAATCLEHTEFVRGAGRSHAEIWLGPAKRARR